MLKTGLLVADNMPDPLPAAEVSPPSPDCFGMLAVGDALLTVSLGSLDPEADGVSAFDVVVALGVSEEKFSVLIVAAPGPLPTAGTRPICLEELGPDTSVEAPTLSPGGVNEVVGMSDDVMVVCV